MSKFMIGSCRLSMDDKYRLRIPAKFRDGVGASAYLMPGREGCLYLVSDEKRDNVLSQFMKQPLYGNDDINNFSTMVMGNSCAVEEDAQGRSVLKKEFRDMIGAVKEVVFVGKGDFVEIWSAETWDAKFSVLNPDNLRRMLSKLSKMNGGNDSGE